MLTCFSCDRQLCFKGSDRQGMADAFGWTRIVNRFYCTACIEAVEGGIPELLPSDILTISPPCRHFSLPAGEVAA